MHGSPEGPSRSCGTLARIVLRVLARTFETGYDHANDRYAEVRAGEIDDNHSIETRTCQTIKCPLDIFMHQI
jgi:hypothetical protein